MDYRETLNLPVTTFPMKASLPRTEPDTLAFWDKIRLYDRLEEAGHGRPRFIMLEAPADMYWYDDNINFAFDKILKDIILKSKRMTGYHTPYDPAWKCFSFRVERDTKIAKNDDTGNLTNIKMRNLSREQIKNIIETKKIVLQRYGILANWSHAEWSMNKQYAEDIVAVMSELLKTGTLVRKKMSTCCCPTCTLPVFTERWQKIKGYCNSCNEPIPTYPVDTWFLSLKPNEIKSFEKILDSIVWIPEKGLRRLQSFMGNRNEWSVSRKGTWGVPLPGFSCKACGEYLTSPDIMMHVSALFGKYGDDVWFTWEADQLLPDNATCPKCNSLAFDKAMDIINFESSAIIRKSAVPDTIQLCSPDVCVIGSSDLNLWLPLVLLNNMLSCGYAPKTVVTHSSVFDGRHRMVSKGSNNPLPPNEVINNFGADILRLYVASQDVDDIPISLESIKIISDAYRRIRNTCRYLLGNISNFDPASDSVAYADLPEMERWALNRLELLKEKVLAAYGRYEIYSIYHDINHFCTVDLSAFYLDINKGRIYPSYSKSPLRRSFQTVMYQVLDTLVRLVAPVLSFTAEEIWKYMPGEREESVHLSQFLPLKPEWKDKELEARWAVILQVRSEVDKALEITRKSNIIGHSIDAMVTISAGPELIDTLRNFYTELAFIMIVSKVELADNIEGDCYCSEVISGLKVKAEKSPGEKCERCWCYSEDLGKDKEHPYICPRCIGELGLYAK